MNEIDKITDKLYEKLNELDLYKLICQYNVVVFGGFIRDIIADIEPNDIDLAIHQERFIEFIDELLYMGYKVNNSEPEVNLYKGNIILEIITCEDKYVMGPSCDPDFNINLLTYDPSSDTLYDWCSGSCGSNEILKIVNDIKKKTAFLIYYNEKRYNKMLNKGFTIITDRSQDIEDKFYDLQI